MESLTPRVWDEAMTLKGSRVDAVSPREAIAKETLKISPDEAKNNLIKRIITASEKDKQTKITQEVSQTDINQNELTKLRFQPRFGVKFTTGPGLGYDGSFTSLEGFLPILQTPGNSLFYLDGKLLLSTDDSLVNGNIVLGHRFYSKKDKRIIGTYFAFDSRNTSENKFEQLGAGFETLGETWDFRANFYVPINNVRQLTDESILETVSPLSLPTFQGNFLVQNQTTQRQINRRFEAAMSGLDFELGMKLASLGKTGNIRGYAGIYYYDAPGTNNIVGGKGRLEINPNNNLKLGLSLSSDEKFGTNLALSAGASLGGKPSNNSNNKQNLLIARLTESVVRNTNIIIDSQIESESTSQTQTVTLTDSTTAQPLTFQHVNLTENNGDGSFENPFNDINQALNTAQNNHIIYVQSNNNSESLGFTIPSDVQVLSSGIEQTINTTQSGIIQLPGSNSGILPTITTTVIMSDRSKISGFNILSTDGPGISANNASDFTIENNAIASQTNTAIELENIGGRVTIAKNTIENSAFGGLSVNNSLPGLDLNINENIITNIGTAATNSNAINLEFNNQGDGIINIGQNQIINNQNSNGITNGIEIKLSNSANRTLNITDNIILNNQGYGVNLSLEDEAAAVLNIQNNQINNNQLSGFNAFLSNSSNAEVNISNNTFDQNQIRGIEFLLSNNTNANINIDSNIITNHQNEGINLLLSDVSTAIANIINNSGANNKINTNLNGIIANATNDSQLRLVIDSNIISNNTSSGTIIQSFNAANIFTSINSNSLTGNNLQDLEIRTFNNSNICSQLSDNFINQLSINDTLGGSIQIEQNNLTNNSITTSSINGTTSVPVVTCSF
ncbi:MAG: hypothetical protein ACFB02_22260 [Mastigocoleus sp.]